MKNKLYGAVLFCILLAVLASFLGKHIAKSMASAAPHPSQQERLERFYVDSIFGPIGQPAQPIPFSAVRLVPAKHYNLYGTVAIILAFAQVVLLVRRIAISVLGRSVQPPPSLTTPWKIILGVALVAWLIAALALLLPRLVFPMLSGEMASSFGLGSAMASAFIAPYFWLLSNNILGPSFFILELLSIRVEGVMPSPNPSIDTDAAR